MKNIELLREKGQALLNAANEYYETCQREGIRGAVIWLDDSEGKTVIFTRGEYRSTLMHNIDSLRQEDVSLSYETI